MFHLASGGAFASLIGGGTNVIVRTFNPELVMTAIEREKVTATLIVPTMIQMLVDHPAFQTADLSSLMRIMYGASPISEALLNRAMWGLPGTAFHQLYGMTELSPLATHLPWDQHTGENAAKKNRQRACGRAAVGSEAQSVHADGNPNAGWNVNAAEIIAFCKERIAGYKCPRSVDVRTEPFPLSGAGKVLKRELRRTYAENGSAPLAPQVKAG